MDRADICSQQRDREAKALKACLKITLITSAFLHLAVLVVLLVRYGTQTNQAQQQAILPEPTPIELTLADPSGASANSGSETQGGTAESGSIAYLAPTTTASADGSEATATNPTPDQQADPDAEIAVEPETAPEPTDDSQPETAVADATPSDKPESSVEAAPVETSEGTDPPAPETSVADATKPGQPESPDRAEQPIAQPETVTTASSVAPETPVTETPAPVASGATIAPPAPVFAKRPANPGASAGSVAANVFGKFLGLPSFSPSKPASSGNGTGGSIAPSTPKPNPNLGTGATSLGGLVARNLDNGLPGFFNNARQQEAALCIVCSKPTYPTRAERMGVTGKAQVSVDYDAQGNVTGVRLSQSSGHPELDQAALEEARKNWKFKPRQNGYQNYVVNVEFRGKDALSTPVTQPRSSQTVAQPDRPIPARRPVADSQPSVHDLMPAAPSQAERPNSVPAAAAPQPAPVETPPAGSALDSDKPFVLVPEVVTEASEAATENSSKQ